MKYLLAIAMIMVSLTSFAADKDKTTNIKLSFNASTMIVDQFFFKTGDVEMSEEDFSKGKFDFKITNIKCHFSTPVYFYELGGGCLATYKGAVISLTKEMSVIVMASIPSNIHGGDAMGSLHYSVKELNCTGRSRASRCSMRVNK